VSVTAGDACAPMGTLEIDRSTAEQEPFQGSWKIGA